MKRRGFTLIELMVTLAVITILAAVLFPVLASAREAARKSACISNHRQVLMALSMYSDSDYDERMVPASYYPDPWEDPILDRKWPQLVAGYVKSFQVFECPDDPSVRPNYDKFFADLSLADANAKYYFRAQRTNLGYNSLYLSPFQAVTSRNWIALPVMRSSITNGAATIVTLDSVWKTNAAGLPTGGGRYFVEPPCRYAVEYGYRYDTLADLDESTYRGWSAPTPVISSTTYGGAYPFHSNAFTVGYLDGHVSSMRPSKLSSGCVVRPAWKGEIIDIFAYQWDLR